MEPGETMTFYGDADDAFVMPPVGTPLYGETTDGERFTLYVVESTEEGIRFGPEKPRQP